jgi:hypothetical protein
MNPRRKNGEIDTKQRKIIRKKRCPWFGGEKKYRVILLSRRAQ